MSEKKPKQNGEIDAFVKALLNKKTEWLSIKIRSRNGKTFRPR